VLVSDFDFHLPQELIALDNAVLLPHVGSASVKTRRAMAECVVSNLFDEFLVERGGEIVDRWRIDARGRSA